jgi:hypothetical protein
MLIPFASHRIAADNAQGKVWEQVYEIGSIPRDNHNLLVGSQVPPRSQVLGCSIKGQEPSPQNERS